LPEDVQRRIMGKIMLWRMALGREWRETQDLEPVVVGRRRPRNWRGAVAEHHHK